jgi:Putative auto-transporter adhesin, head GIN domain
MKKNILLIAILISTIAVAQKKEKVKGSKLVTTEKFEVAAFDQIEIEDNLEVFLVKGDKNSIEIETDDNLQAAINHQTYGTSLRLNTNKEITGFKKLEVRVTYTDNLKLITNRHEAKLNIQSVMELENITIKTFDYSKSVLNINVANFTLLTNDKSKVEVNIKSQEAFIEISKNAAIKGLITSNKLKLDQYQKGEALVEGEVNEMKLRLDNNATFDGKKLNIKTLDLTTEANSNCNIYTNGNVSIAASGKSEVTIFGDPKIDLKKFANEATLYKKIKKE